MKSKERGGVREKKTKIKNPNNYWHGKLYWVRQKREKTPSEWNVLWDQTM
jgi:hypothetical protein